MSRMPTRLDCSETLNSARSISFKSLSRACGPQITLKGRPTIVERCELWNAGVTVDKPADSRLECGTTPETLPKIASTFQPRAEARYARSPISVGFKNNLAPGRTRSEERRVGKECRARRPPAR